jgi:aminoglycoside 6'-N-acetyltransferase
MADDPADYEVMARWLSDPAVLEWYEGRDDPFDIDRVARKFGPRVMGEERVVPCIIEHGPDPIGYIQFYPLNADQMAEYDLELQTAFGIDMFIGEPRLWGQGLGSRALDCLARHLIEERRATVLTLDPQVSNLRAIRAYEKAGFARAKLLPDNEMHEGRMRDGLLMVRRAASIHPTS